MHRPSADGTTSSDFECDAQLAVFRQHPSQNYNVDGRQCVFINRGAAQCIVFALRLPFLHPALRRFALAYCLSAPCTWNRPRHVPPRGRLHVGPATSHATSPAPGSSRTCTASTGRPGDLRCPRDVPSSSCREPSVDSRRSNRKWRTLQTRRVRH